MFNSIIEDIKREYRYGNMVTRLILWNVAIFVVLLLVQLVALLSFGGNDGMNAFIYKYLMPYIALQGDGLQNLIKPWVWITHMFVHLDFFHILWNMLFLYWFGRILVNFLGKHRIVPVYVLGGLAGAGLALVLSYIFKDTPIFNFSYAIGASAGVSAILWAAATLAPDYNIRLLIFGDVKLKWIALFAFLLDLARIIAMDNTGGAAAHIGGALFGYLFILQLQNGRDMSLGFNNFVNGVQYFFANLGDSGTKQKPSVIYKNKEKKGTTKKRSTLYLKSKKGKIVPPNDIQNRLDTILDKIKKEGVESLSAEEKNFLNNASDNI